VITPSYNNTAESDGNDNNSHGRKMWSFQNQQAGDEKQHLQKMQREQGAKRPTARQRKRQQPADWPPHDPDNLIAEIRKAFKGVTRGAGLSLHQGRQVDILWVRDCDTVKRAVRHDPETRWDQVADAKMEDLCDALTFVDAEGFRFYIPAYMIYGLNNPDTHVARQAIFLLVRGQRLQNGGFTRDQILASVAFLRYMQTLDGDVVSYAGLGALERWARTAKMTS